MWYPKKSFIPYIIMIIVGISCWWIVYLEKEKPDAVLSFIATVVSLVVSLYAYYIASRTYQSIDSVNAITQMDGNVLENESYVTPMTLLLKDYDMHDSKEFGDEVFKILEIKFSRESKTAITFADNLQYFIDIIVFFPYLFKSKDEKSEEHVERMKNIIEMIKNKTKAFKAISNGNLILIDETVKLIDCVINYQQLVATSDEQKALTLLEVRGTMLKNSVTQTVYYNYLGLFYNAKAHNVLRKRFTHLGDLFSLDALRFIKKNVQHLSDEERELFTMYLQEAKRAFQKALGNGQADMMWEGFIKYNEARAVYFLQLATSGDYAVASTAAANQETPERDWATIMNEAVRARTRLNILMKDIFQNESTYLQDAFIFESFLAGFVRINIMIAEEMDITDTFGRAKYTRPYYQGLLNDPFMTEAYEGNDTRIKDYQDRIRSFLSHEIVRE